MVINKIGWHHLAYGMNCQDAGWETEGLKAVCDGCSEGKHSEVGAKGFCHLLETGLPPAEAFVKLTALFGQTPDSIRDYLCFTVLLVRETAEAFILTYCGDGYVLGGDTGRQISDAGIGRRGISAVLCLPICGCGSAFTLPGRRRVSDAPIFETPV